MWLSNFVFNKHLGSAGRTGLVAKHYSVILKGFDAFGWKVTNYARHLTILMEQCNVLDRL